MAGRRTEICRCRPFCYRRRPARARSWPMSKTFGGLRAVQNVDIVVVDKTPYALIGPNGAKTTAFNLFSGLYVPDVDPGGASFGISLPASPPKSRRPGSVVFRLNLFRRAGRRGEHPPMPQARDPYDSIHGVLRNGVARSQRSERARCCYLGPRSAERSRLSLIRRPAAARHGSGAQPSAHPTAGRAARRSPPQPNAERIGNIIKADFCGTCPCFQEQ